MSSNTCRKEEKALQTERKETFNPFLAEQSENKTRKRKSRKAMKNKQLIRANEIKA